MTQRCVSQKFHESLIFFKGVEAHNNTIDAQYNQINAQSRIRRNPAATSSGTLPTRETTHLRDTSNQPSKENVGSGPSSSKMSQQSGPRKTSGSINNRSTTPNNSTRTEQQQQSPRTSTTKELHDVYEVSDC